MMRILCLLGLIAYASAGATELDASNFESEALGTFSKRIDVCH